MDKQQVETPRSVYIVEELSDLSLNPKLPASDKGFPYKKLTIHHVGGKGFVRSAVILRAKERDFHGGGDWSDGHIFF